MADQKISALTSYTPAISTDVFPVVDITTGTTKKITLSNLITSLGLSSVYQPLDSDLTVIAGLSSADSNVIVGSAGGWVAESGATARTSLGLGTGDSPIFTTITGQASDITVYSATAFDHFNVEGYNSTTATAGAFACLRLAANWSDGSYGAVLLNAVSSNSYSCDFTIQQRRSDGNYYESMRIDSAGNVGINIAAPTGKEQVNYSANYFNIQWGANFNHADYFTYETGDYGVNIGYSKAGGTFASPSLVGANETIGQWMFYGHDGSGFHQAAKIVVKTEATPSDGTDMPGRIEFYTTPNASGTPVERMRIDSAGLVTVTGNIDNTGVYKVAGTQVVGNRVIDARCDDAINSGDATTDGVIDALRDAMIAHGLIAAA